MDVFNKEQLQELAHTQEHPCVSLFMPAYRVEAEQAQNPIRFKNLLKEAKERLKDAGYREQEVEELLAPAQARLGEERFWHNQSDGLAVFLTPSSVRFYRLPVHFEEIVTVGERFHLKPLFPLIASNNLFYILALSQNQVRLFQGTHYSIGEIEAEEIPGSITEALFYDDPERQLQGHTGTLTQDGRHDQVFHGQGRGAGDTDDAAARPNDALRRFFQKVDSGVQERLDGERAPLVLAGVEYYLPIYRDVNHYPHLVESEIAAGNPDHLSPKALHEKAWTIVEPMFLESQQVSMEQFEQLRGNGGGLASEDLKEIIPAAVFSRIDTLFVPVGEHRWGHYDANANAVELHDERQAGDDDLYDFAAVHAYLNGGTVHALRPQNMPSEGTLAATFRYPADVAATEQ